MTEYLRSAKDRKNAILNDTPDTKFYFESQKFSDIPNYQNRSVENPYQRNDWGAQEVRKYSGLINAAAARYSIDPDVVKAIIYTEVSRGFYGFAAEKAGVAGTWFPGNINTDWQKLIPGSDVRKPADNIELTTKLISQIAKRLDDPSIENIYSLYNGLSHDRTYVNKEAKTTPYFAKMAIEAKAWEKDDWYSPEFPKDPPREVLAPDRREFSISASENGAHRRRSIAQFRLTVALETGALPRRAAPRQLRPRNRSTTALETGALLQRAVSTIPILRSCVRWRSTGDQQLLMARYRLRHKVHLRHRQICRSANLPSAIDRKMRPAPRGLRLIRGR
jgi:hypothetical protein